MSGSKWYLGKGAPRKQFFISQLYLETLFHSREIFNVELRVKNLLESILSSMALLTWLINCWNCQEYLLPIVINIRNSYHTINFRVLNSRFNLSSVEAKRWLRNRNDVRHRWRQRLRQTILDGTAYGMNRRIYEEDFNGAICYLFADIHFGCW